MKRKKAFELPSTTNPLADHPVTVAPARVLDVTPGSHGTLISTTKVELVNHALQAANSLITCIGSVMEKRYEWKVAQEQTQQVLAQAQAFIVGAQEETKRIEIVETQATERCRIAFAENIARLKQQVELQKMSLEKEKANLMESSHRFDRKMDQLELTLQSLLGSYNQLNDMIMGVFDNGYIPDQFMLQQFDGLRSQIGNLAADIARLD